MTNKYPRITELGLVVYDKPRPHVIWDALRPALRARGLEERFSKFFGVQTACADGPYAGDVEAVLERMATGKLTGSQKDWD